MCWKGLHGRGVTVTTDEQISYLLKLGDGSMGG